MRQFTSTNPYNGETFETWEGFDLDQLDQVMSEASDAQRPWEALEPADRARHLSHLAQTLRDNEDDLARLITREMGKPLAASLAEVEKCAWVCEYYAAEGEAMLADRPFETHNTKSYLSYRPLGVVLGIMPWNFPLWQAFRFLAPTLMAGNAIVLKHASNVPGCAMAIERTVLQAGLPKHLFRTLLIGSDEAEAVIRHPLVRGVSFTGSEKAGATIAGQAGSEVKKSVLELGGSDPYLVLEDADLEAAVETCVASRLINNGQSCIAAKRFIVHESLYQGFIDRMVNLMAGKKLGDPLNKDTDVGPLARADLCQAVAKQVERSRSAGASLALGGEAQDNFYHPTVLTDVQPGMAAFDEEVFGPVAAVIKADSDDQAIALANQSQYGLGAAVFTRDAARGELIARNRLQAGCCFVNALVASDPRLPFGGIKASGYGRELGPLGIHEFANAKTVVVK